MTLASVAMLAVTALTVILCVLARRRLRERANFLMLPLVAYLASSPAR